MTRRTIDWNPAPAPSKSWPTTASGATERRPAPNISARHKVGPNTFRYDLNPAAGGPRFQFGSPQELVARVKNNQVQNGPAQMSQIGPKDMGGPTLTQMDPGAKVKGNPNLDLGFTSWRPGGPAHSTRGR